MTIVIRKTCKACHKMVRRTRPLQQHRQRLLKAPQSTTRDSTAMLRAAQARKKWSTSHHANSLSSETSWARSTANKSLTKALLLSSRTRPWFSRTMVSSNCWRSWTHSSATQIRAVDLSTTAPRTWSCRTWTWVPNDHDGSTITFQFRRHCFLYVYEI